ncbi:MAG: haloacid dehalogenase [Sphingomonas sp.]|nr:haloacid dehalogenase [Sphingomonas sp.]
MTNRLAIFDCDGTLADSQANICLAMEEAFSGAKLTPPERTLIRRIVGLNLVEAMAQLLPDADMAMHRVLAESYKDCFRRMRVDGTLLAEPLFDGIAETLGALEDAGWVLGVATGKSDRGLHLLLDHHGVRHRFVTLQTADRHPSKPHPSMIEAAIAEAGASPETSVMIGDTSFDMAMGVAAGVHPIGVGWGYHPPEELVAAGARTVANDTQAMQHYLEAL